MIFEMSDRYTVLPQCSEFENGDLVARRVEIADNNQCGVSISKSMNALQQLQKLVFK